MKSLEETHEREFSAAMSAEVHRQLYNHLLKNQRQEEVAFALYKPSIGNNRFTSLIYKIILPEAGDRQQHGNVDILPQFFKRACRQACSEGAGLALLHSHPGKSRGWQEMSFDDVKTEESYAPPSATMTDLPFVGLTLSGDGIWSARMWHSRKNGIRRQDAGNVRIVGKKLRASFNDDFIQPPKFKETFRRTLTVWGPENHMLVARLKVAVVGLGSVGSMVVEMLARMGLQKIVLIDFDEVQQHNLDRLMGVTAKDIGTLKTTVMERHLWSSATAEAFEVQAFPYAVTEQKGYYAALDCDVAFSCVDRPWPRSVLNHLAYSHLIPVIDGGIAVRLNRETANFEGADWQTQTVGPERPCLQCLEAFSASDVSTEREGKLDDPTYIKGLPRDHMFNRNENIFPFSANLASMEVLQFIEMVTGIGAVDYFGPQRYSYNQGYIRLLEKEGCNTGCLYCEAIAQGDTLFPAPIGYDHAFAKARVRQGSI